MRVPIPQDWNGEDWACYQVHWPASDAWTALLLGFLSYPMRGRYWDERTGSIRDIQQVGFEIWARSSDLLPCALCPDPDSGCSECDQASCSRSGQGGAILVDEDENMGQVVTDIQIVGGKIRVFYGPCCFHDLEGIDLSVGTEDEVDSPYAPAEGEDTNTYSACAKAWAVVDAIEAMMSAAYDVVDLGLLPWMWPGRVETAMDMNLNDKWTVAMILDWTVYGIILTPENAFTDEDQQKSVAALMSVFANDAAGVPDDATYEAVKNAIHTRGLIYDGLIMTAIAALGRKNLDSVAQLGALSGETRGCGEPVIDPEILFGDVVWRRQLTSLPRENGEYTFLGRLNNGLTLHHQFVSIDDGFAALGLNWNLDILPGVLVTELVLAAVPILPVNELLHTEWNPAGGCAQGITEEMTVGSIGPAPTTTDKKVDNDALYYKATWAVGQSTITFGAGEMRVCPQPPVTPRTYEWQVHIVSVNGENQGVFADTTWP